MQAQLMALDCIADGAATITETIFENRFMILVRVPDAAAAFAGMKAHGVLVKNVETLHPLLAGCLRLTVGTPDENAKMIEALRASLR